MTAREVSEIQKTLNEAQAAETELAVFNSTSQTSLFGKFKYIFAVCSNLVEQLFDLFTIDNEAEIAKAAPGSDGWIQKKILEFQYNATNPQVTEIDANFVPNYPVVDTTLCIISRASVKTGPNKTCLIKVATGDPPAPLSGPQLTSLNGYINNSGSPTTNGKGIGFAGVKYSVSSSNPDLLLVSGELIYDGQFSSVIEANVVTAINKYLSEIPFDGIFRVNRMIDYIQAVPGVIDFVFEDIGLRIAGSTFPTDIYYLCYASQIISATYPLNAGYAVGETTATFNLGDNITFTAQN